MNVSCVAGVHGGLVVDKVICPTECDTILTASFRHGFKGKSGHSMFAGNRERAAYMDTDLADLMFHRLKPVLQELEYNKHTDEYHSTCEYTPPSGTYQPVGINPFMRVSKYSPGGEFRWHTDTVFSDGPNNVGFQTVLLYLNEDFEGGETDLQIQQQDDDLEIRSVQPRLGRVLVFDHTCVHQGCYVSKGIKYVLRTEVMFSKST